MKKISWKQTITSIIVETLLLVLLYLFGYFWAIHRVTILSEPQWANIAIAVVMGGLAIMQLWLIFKYTLFFFMIAEDPDASARVVGRAAGVYVVDAVAIAVAYLVNLIGWKVTGGPTVLPYLITVGVLTYGWTIMKLIEVRKV